MAIFLNGGRAIATNLVSALGGTAPLYLGWGTGSTAEAAAQTGLATPSSEARTLGTATRTTTTLTNDTVKVVGTITSTQTQTIQEVVLFDAASSGNAFIRALTGGQALNNNDAITFTITWQLL